LHREHQQAERDVEDGAAPDRVDATSWQVAASDAETPAERDEDWRLRLIVVNGCGQPAGVALTGVG
jgi:hypothetical protein